MSTFRAGLQPTVLSNQAYKSLRSAILTGKLSAGSQLVVRELSESLELSPTPIKSALTTLESEGLVISIPYRGFFIPTFDVSDITEVFGVREALERKTARLAALRCERNHVRRLESLLDEQKTLTAAETVLAHDLQFHQAIAEMSGNGRLFDLAYTVLSQAHLILATSRDIVQPDLSEHRRIATAISAGDADAAEEAVWRHNRDTCIALIKNYDVHGEVAAGDIETLLSYRSLADLELEQAYLESQLNESQKNALYDALAEYIGPMAVVVGTDILAKQVILDTALKQMAQRIPDRSKAAAFVSDAKAALAQI